MVSMNDWIMADCTWSLQTFSRYQPARRPFPSWPILTFCSVPTSAASIWNSPGKTLIQSVQILAHSCYIKISTVLMFTTLSVYENLMTNVTFTLSYLSSSSGKSKVTHNIALPSAPHYTLILSTLNGWHFLICSRYGNGHENDHQNKTTAKCKKNFLGLYLQNLAETTFCTINAYFQFWRETILAVMAT